MADTEHKRPSAGQWLARRGSLVAYLLVVLAVLVAVNILASRHDRSWDLTKNKVNSLSRESDQVLSGLKSPLQLIYFDKSDNFASERNFLGEYQRASNQVEVRYVDPDRHPDEARQYKIQNYGTLVVKHGTRQALVTNLDEQSLTNAIIRVLKGSRKVVYFVQGEGERDPDDSGRSGYSDLKQALQSENFTVQKLVLAQTLTIPSDCAVLVVAGPTHPMVAPEIQAISNYINQGGRALFMVNVETTGPLIDYLTNQLNVKLTPDVVVDTSGIGRLFGASELMPIVATYDPHPITNQMNSTATLFPYARTVEPGNSTTSKAVVLPLAETTPQSLATTHFAGNQVNVDPATDRHGPLTLGVAGTLAVAGAKPPAAGATPDEARFVVYGSPDFVSNGIIGFNGNQDLILNTMDWLASQQNFITIRPHSATNAPVNLSAAQMRTLLISLAAVPLLVALLGLGIWWRRRSL